MMKLPPDARSRFLRTLQENAPNNRDRKRKAKPDGLLLRLSGRVRELEKQVAELSRLQRLHMPDRQAKTPLDLTRLTTRERQVLKLFSRYHQVSPVAKKLKRSVHTVRNQLSAIQRKLGISSRAKLLIRLGRENIFEGDCA